MLGASYQEMLGAELIRSRVCQGPSMLGAELSSIHLEKCTQGLWS